VAAVPASEQGTSWCRPDDVGFSARGGRVVDSDVDLHDPAQEQETRPRQWDLLLAISAGGVLGALARYGVAEAIPPGAGAFPWSTLLVNATGSLLIGVLMVVVLDLTSQHRLVRPFLGAGVLGGYTTYSTFAVDAQRLVLAHEPLLALGYVAATVVTCTAAVWAGMLLTHAGARMAGTRWWAGAAR
jgi:CrcB protein